MSVKKRVVITGMGVVSPIGVGKDKFWQSLLDGAAGTKKVSLFDTEGWPTRHACEIDADFTKYLGAKMKYLDRSTRFILTAAKMAIDDSGLDVTDENRDDIGVVTGTAFGCLHSNFKFHRIALLENPSYVNPMHFPSALINAASSHVSITFRLDGMNATISSGENASLDAFGYARDMIRDKRAKVILLAGLNDIEIELYIICQKLGLLAPSSNGTAPKGRPFDAKRNGLILGEGAAALMLEELSSAEKRGASILAEVVGYGTTFDSSDEGRLRAMRLALADAGVEPSEIEYINANANGLIGLDYSEGKAIQTLFGSDSNLVISSIKSMIGDCYGASGAFQAASTCLSIKNGLIPPTLNYGEPDEKLNLPGTIADQAIKKDVNLALINSFGHEGTNSSLILKKFK